MEKEEIIEEIRAYLQHILLVNDCYEVYKSLTVAFSEHVEEVNLAPGFFQITMDTVIYTFSMGLAKLYVGSGKEKTLRRLLNLLKANQQFFPRKKITETFQMPDGTTEEEKFRIHIKDVLQEYERDLLELSPIINNLKGRRDHYLAHSDTEYFTKSAKIERDYPLSFNDAEKLIKYADSFCNRMLFLLTNEVFYCKSRNADDLSELLLRVNRNGD